MGKPTRMKKLRQFLIECPKTDFKIESCSGRLISVEHLSKNIW